VPRRRVPYDGGHPAGGPASAGVAYK
jgi:hypothetical protein